MTTESILWFVLQAIAAAAAAVAGLLVARTRPVVWKPVAVVATLAMLLWPLMRVFPAAVLAVLDAGIVIFIEVTGIVIPAALLFALASGVVQRARDRRALRLLMVVCAFYYVRSGFWMVRPPVPELRTAPCVDGVCCQSTDYTCVAASLVTLLHAYGIAATETEMARLSYTEVGNGATDTRAVYALQRKLAGRPFKVHYERWMTYERLIGLERPCIVPVKWGYFSSHMVPVLEADAESVLVGDPLGGPRRRARAAFEADWLHRAVYLVERGE